jgi:hypothetical protein
LPTDAALASVQEGDLMPKIDMLLHGFTLGTNQGGICF